MNEYKMDTVWVYPFVFPFVYASSGNTSGNGVRLRSAEERYP